MKTEKFLKGSKTSTFKTRLGAQEPLDMVWYDTRELLLNRTYLYLHDVATVRTLGYRKPCSLIGHANRGAYRHDQLPKPAWHLWVWIFV